MRVEGILKLYIHAAVFGRVEWCVICLLFTIDWRVVVVVVGVFAILEEEFLGVVGLLLHTSVLSTPHAESISAASTDAFRPLLLFIFFFASVFFVKIHLRRVAVE